MKSAGLTTMVFLSLAACGATEEQLRARAAFDLGCPEEKLRLVEIDRRTTGVTGCGQKATYVESCARGRSGCTWVLNGETKSATE